MLTEPCRLSDAAFMSSLDLWLVHHKPQQLQANGRVQPRSRHQRPSPPFASSPGIPPHTQFLGYFTVNIREATTKRCAFSVPQS